MSRPNGLIGIVATALLLMGLLISGAPTPASAGSGPTVQPRHDSLAILSRAREAALRAGTVHTRAYVVAHYVTAPGTSARAREWIDGYFFTSRPIRYSMKAHIAIDRATSRMANHERYTYQLIVDKRRAASLTTKSGWKCRKTVMSDAPPGSGSYTSVVMPGLTTHLRHARLVGTTTLLGVPVYHVKLRYYTAFSQQNVRKIVSADEYISQRDFKLIRLVARGTARVNGLTEKFTIFDRFDRYGAGFLLRLPPQCQA